MSNWSNSSIPLGMENRNNNSSWTNLFNKAFNKQEEQRAEAYEKFLGTTLHNGKELPEYEYRIIKN